MSHIITYYVFQWSIAVSAADLIQYLLLISCLCFFLGEIWHPGLLWYVLHTIMFWPMQLMPGFQTVCLIGYLKTSMCRHILSKPLYPKISMFIYTSTFHILIFQRVFSLSCSHVLSMQMKHVLQPRGSCGRQEGRRGDEATLTLQPERVGRWASAAPNMNESGIVCPSPSM